MSAPADMRKERAARPLPLVVKDAGDFEGRALPQREWIVPTILPRRAVALVSGAGGGGKTALLMQLQVCAALGEPWFGLQLPEDGMVSFGLYCEDDEDEVHRRLDNACKHYGCTFRDIKDKVLYAARVGEGNEMMRFGFGGGRDRDMGETTALYSAVENMIRMRGVQLTILDTVADIFMGNENVRPQVRSFITAIRRLSLINNGGVIMTAHPSRAGLADGSGLSGSTGWEGSVRSRAYLTKPKVKDGDIDGEEGQTNERILKLMKSNYGPAGGIIKLLYSEDEHVFVLNADRSGTLVDHIDWANKLIEAAKWLMKRGDTLSALPRSRTALVNKALLLPSCKGMSFKQALATQERLLADGRLKLVEMGPASKRTIYIRPADVRYPGEARGEGDEG